MCVYANVGVCMRRCAYCCDFFLSLYYYYIQELWYIFSDMIRDMTGDDTQKRLISKAQSRTRAKKNVPKTVEHIVSSMLSHNAVKFERMKKEQQQQNRKRFPIDIISRCWFGFIILTWVLRNTHAHTHTHPHWLSIVACKREQIYEMK